MEKLAHSIAQKISTELNYDNDQKEIIAYGTFALLQMVFSIFLVIIFGYKFNVLVEALIISFTTSILRKYSGGVHASSSGICMLVGTVICIGQALLVVFILKSLLSLKFISILGVIVYLWAYFIILRLAPVDSPAKPIKKEEKRKRMKRSSVLVLSFYVFLTILNVIIYINTINVEFLVYCLCIFLGVAWQVFTLTKIGWVTLRFVDNYFNYIAILLGRGRVK